MSNVHGVIPSAAAGVPLTPAKRTRLEYSTAAKTGLIDPATKNDYNFNFPTKNNSSMHTEEFKIPEFIDIENEKIALTYRECVAACSYCKKVVKKNKDSKSKYQSKKSQKTTYGVNNAKNNNQNIVGLAPSSILDTKINNLLLDAQNTIDKKNGKKKLAQKSLNGFQNF
ncbi:hypothetical protein BB561_006543 [Smittium simulii]|uniref:Uncharacterized protein n=1 Tax=Smittium simulii TaxID=133385 RepID=A0A2T9Y373_9FUNG|nr:hypothetical protein BB561_006543 [Smittium simulii]